MTDVDYKNELSSLRQDIGEVKSLMSKMVDAISKIALLEERQGNVASVTGKILDRVEGLEKRQHDYELANASNGNIRQRLDLVELGFREIHVEREKEKARTQTVVWMVRGLWAIVAGGGLVWISKVALLTGAGA